MDNTDQAMLHARELFDKSEMTLDDLGQKMGYAPKIARKSAWQFLNKTADPRLSMLRRFCKAIGVSAEELIAENKRSRSK
jgi:transcriptional regulator with XRE-family HTH domain